MRTTKRGTKLTRADLEALSARMLEMLNEKESLPVKADLSKKTDKMPLARKFSEKNTRMKG